MKSLGRLNKFHELLGNRIQFWDKKQNQKSTQTFSDLRAKGHRNFAIRHNRGKNLLKPNLHNSLKQLEEDKRLIILMKMCLSTSMISQKDLLGLLFY